MFDLISGKKVAAASAGHVDIFQLIVGVQMA